MPHSRLLYKMEHYGVQSKISSWINAFLGNRKQEVVHDGAHSAQTDVLSGMPQRTVLGPLLFLAYINDLPESLRTSDCRLFANDSLLYCIVICCDNDKLQRDLSSLEEWEKMWQMSFNSSKCTVIRVSTGKKKKAYQSSYTLHGQLLEVVDSSKYLGVTVNEDLSWSKHILDTATKTNHSLGFLQRNFKDCYSFTTSFGVCIFCVES